ncbi:MAG: MerR family transcriptional regulator [Bacteroidales bacterium]
MVDLSKIEIDSARHHYSIGEVAEMFEMNVTAIRHWEKEIPMLKPYKNGKGTRFFTPQNMEMLKQIYYLVNTKGMSLKGVNTALQSGDEMTEYGKKQEVLIILNKIKRMLEDAKESL